MTSQWPHMLVSSASTWAIVCFPIVRNWWHLSPLMTRHKATEISPSQVIVFLWDWMKHDSVVSCQINDTTCNRSTEVKHEVLLNLVLGCSLARLPCVTLPLSVGSMGHWAPSLSQGPRLHEDQLLYPPPRNTQSVLSLDCYTTERPFCYSREVHHNEDNRQKDREGNHTQSKDHVTWPDMAVGREGEKQTWDWKFIDSKSLRKC